ncbi:class I SAM-dependent RNA methyltransferase [Azospirillum thermophilum]|uniref:Class I SAM-dependent RNA methyltransferase n=1 Tax=Azospirillum thermophilum TaxID=2202148 RepID=A0A2S2CTN5_9PROT|nr:methyltransferase [Azospirillum thermophilum]AWK87874.1 class I SAM-dependent RNA methyltransferase [Azospirillum thermophilum]
MTRPTPRRPSAQSRKSQPQRRAAAPAAEPRVLDLTIGEIGARGDGIAEAEGTRIFVPLTVPGDRVRVRVAEPASTRGEGLRAELLDLLEPGPGRAEPACGHFGRCGGCTLQHLDDSGYAAWKVGLVRGTLSRVGLGGVPLEPLSRTPRGARRRARFAALKRGGRVWFGFNERMSHRLADLADCPVLTPRLTALIAPLRDLLAGVLPDGGACDVVASDLEGGIDLLLVGPRSLDRAARDRLVSFGEDAVARISWQADDRGSPEPIAHRRPAAVRFAGVPVTPPPGAFLQASAEGEAALVTAVTRAVGEAVGQAGRVADLFAGIGTFALPLARSAAVHAVEGDAAAVAALGKAVAGQRLTVERRDLFEAPLSAKELSRFDAVVFDPPRAGAAAQAEALAQSKVPLVVGVSCNPATFARDARTLVDGGYALSRVYPVDQFLWSAHVELVGVFRRP